MNIHHILASPESSKIELAPINEMISSLVDKPASLDHPPAFLEPVPITENYRCNGTFVPHIFFASSANLKDVPSLVPSSASSISSDASNPPSPHSNVNSFQQHTNNHNSSQIPCRYAPLLQSIQPKPYNANTCHVAHPSSPSFNCPRSSNNIMVDASGLPLSPTMMAASVAANAASAQNHTGSIVENTFLNSLTLSSDDNNARKRQRLNNNDSNTIGQATTTAAAAVSPSPTSANPSASDSSFARVSFMLHGAKRTCPMGANQRMFLTKNAHIKRPRNAWIHFRCHYGQALKSQDPTLRAEEISKRASRRWARLAENEKKPWHDLAEQDKQAHKAAFPEYRYCPRRSNTAAMIASQNALKSQKQQQQQDEAVCKSLSSRI
ncbi:hypothetical protein MAM1_0040d02867 [Mucor ambiguus]|uniref:HMG box domain-containing protein n=1 Tax=Mucor ambiguus TaxID=91626 RepID=A0A0C9M8G0_9FUNG|nr:hypothetical protein MAM1_0040d02867 [Mucor ambiguus]